MVLLHSVCNLDDKLEEHDSSGQELECWLVEICVLLQQALLCKNSAPDQATGLELELEEFSIKSYIIDGKIHLEVNNEALKYIFG